MADDRLPPRWTLSRAGIVNVYQYSDETLQFRGGRLLLRGVNGSGKSTAMNMLLPFLIDADPRRIDAAGQQTGVLSSWMLAGRDDQQPVGYLWIELGRTGPDGDDEWFACGCGIRANRSTQRVTTWWFATDRRPGIDIALVENRVPLSVDALRATLGAAAVFTEDQRGAYRAEVRRRLFGGADVDQHISLLHMVRSPRVGDQIDRDLPEHLTAALPALSEQAIADAAQPLDDLDDHRRNVEELTRTTQGLASLTATYQRYARSELRRRATHAGELVVEATAAHRKQHAAASSLRSAEREGDEGRARIAALEVDDERLRNELLALRSSDAFREGANLVVLRERVRSLEDQVAEAAARVERHADLRRAAASATDEAHARLRTDLVELADELDALATLAARTSLAERPPDTPSVAATRLDDEVDVPAGELDIAPTESRLGAVRASAQRRSLDVDEVGAARAALDAATAELAQARRREDRARQDVGAATTAFGDARELLAAANAGWVETVGAWVDDLRAADPERLVQRVHAFELPRVATLIEDRGAARSALAELATELVLAVADREARLVAAVDAQGAARDQAAAALAELEARSEPEPPRATWQRADIGGPRFGDLVDFADHLTPDERAGLEAAMEAAGVLGAEVRADAGTSAGALVLESGDLVALGGEPVAHPLADLLVVTVPDDVAGTPTASSVAAVLASISTRSGDGSATAVGTDGTFRVGALHGRHHKPAAEHIGASARRALLERQRQAARRELAELEQQLADAQRALADRRAQHARVDAHARALPATRAVDEAALTAESAERRLDGARATLGECEAATASADERTAAAGAELHRRATSLHLPVTADELAAVDGALRRIGSGCDGAVRQARAARRTFGDWQQALERWRKAAAEHITSERSMAGLRAELDPIAMQLATLEDSIGLEYEEILGAIATSEHDLEATHQQLDGARRAAVDNAALVATRRQELQRAGDDCAAADRRCIDGVAALRAALTTRGLVAAAQIDPSAPLDLGPDEVTDHLPPVEQSVDGLRALSAAVLDSVPEPSEGDTTADGVRNSLRQRRDSLAAGWDAEDRQPDPALPMAIDVTGPSVGGRVPLADALTRVSAQLRDQEGLLTQKQNQALRNLLQGLIAAEVAERLQAAIELVARINRRLETVTTSHGVGVRLRWRRRDDLDLDLTRVVDLLAKPPDLRLPEEDEELSKALSARLDEARRLDGEASYRELIERVLDYRQWNEMSVLLRRPGRNEERLTRRTPLSEGEKKLVTYLPLFAAVAASCDGLARNDPGAARFLVLDDAFAKVSEDNHAALFGLLVDFDLDFIATSERLWGTHATVPSLAITEVIRDADLGVIVLEHATWDGRGLEPSS